MGQNASARRFPPLKGFVRNVNTPAISYFSNAPFKDSLDTYDSIVEILVEGARKDIDGLIEWCKTRGSPDSKVKGVEVRWYEAVGDMMKFVQGSTVNDVLTEEEAKKLLNSGEL